MFNRFLLTVAALMGVCVTPAFAGAKTYDFNKPHTQILFFVDHMGFSHSSGRFLDFDGSLTYDPEKPAESSTQVTIKTDSLEMNDAKWNEHLKSPDFFNVAQYPTMNFASTKVEPVDATHAKITGDLTMLGQTHPVTLDVTLNKCGEQAMTKQETCGFDATGSLKRTEWGMDKFVPMVGDDVKLMITVEAPVQSGANQ
ncbi:MAG: polyisoprenoid-binding protein [Rhodospirillales bacterium]|nr:polyisoprenoid-binding protein [Alphaproteobacteria bacterium]MCB9986429.1 polyisoprenoid-binding protein [Rhodospirillales bacterium]USO07025.1 MAG: polyisoprenoid-binding protein [Rhodospirillales bacterium]